jgi:F0F1-type ATP synthase assembly protein I
MMTFLRAHYCIDMIAGAMIGHYIWILTDKYIFYFDYYILGIPLEKRIATIDQLNIQKKQ